MTVSGETYTSADYAEFLSQRREKIMARVEKACAKVGRDTADVTVFCVSKTVDVDAVIAAMRAGYRDFAENRPQELARKVRVLESSGRPVPRFDMVGNLQKNKINMVLEYATMIQSVSSLHLAEALSKRALAKMVEMPVLLEVNVSGEDSKSGFSPAEVQDLAEHLAKLPGLSIRGLMTMAPKGDPVEARTTFAGLRQLRDDLQTESSLVLPQLSCGMSDDFEAAIEEGSTILRLGRVVFDPSYHLE